MLKLKLKSSCGIICKNPLSDVRWEGMFSKPKSFILEHYFATFFIKVTESFKETSLHCNKCFFFSKWFIFFVHISFPKNCVLHGPPIDLSFFLMSFYAITQKQVYLRKNYTLPITLKQTLEISLNKQQVFKIPEERPPMS